MVKTIAAFILAAGLLLNGCASRQLIDVHPELLVLPSGAPGEMVSLSSTGESLVGIYSDRETTTLDSFALTVGSHLPATPPASQVIDTIDFAPPLSSAFGQHVLAVSQGKSAVLYTDREGADKLVLKLAWKTLDSPQWMLSVLEPSGSPVAVLPSPSGGFDSLWASDALLAQTASPPLARTVLSPFVLNGRPSVAGDGAVTAFDDLSKTLFAVQRGTAGYSARRVPEAGPVQAALLAPHGGLSVLSWDRASRRLILQERGQDGELAARVTVTLCDGTANVALLPGPTPSTYLFLFDEVRRVAGRDVHQLSLIAPARSFFRVGLRYRKAILKTGAQPVQAFAAVRSSRALYVLVLQGELTMLRLDLPDDGSAGTR